MAEQEQGQKRALLGLHNAAIAQFMPGLLPTCYSPTSVASVEEMVAEMTSGTGITAPTGTLAHRPFDVYVIDANLGRPGEVDCSPLKTVLEYIADDVKAGSNLPDGRVVVIPISGNPDLVALATGQFEKYGIKCYLNTELRDALSENGIR
ncbi:hypothetical protein J4401_01495 [Candidatus Woesearchaeota archaeon]|nr:hypothetical protein [Candidatus Woesearchaeota archaeon]